MAESNAVARREDAPKPPLRTGGKIAGIVPQNIEEAFRLAQALARAGDMIPKQFQGSPDKIMAAIIKGAEVGLAPSQALSSIAVINGRPTIWGDALMALIQRAGHHVDVEWQGEGDERRAVATLTRGDNGRQTVRSFGMSDAKRAGLVGKQGPWAQYTDRMLMMRARSYAVRDGAADALMGLDVMDMEPATGPETARDVTPRPSRFVREDATDAPAADPLAAAFAPAPEPPADVMDDAEPVEMDLEAEHAAEVERRTAELFGGAG